MIVFWPVHLFTVKETFHPYCGKNFVESYIVC